MPIPGLTELGCLPAGIHDCTLLELKEAFGTNRWAQDPSVETRREVLCPQRRHLYEWLERYLEELRAATLIACLLVDGSFVTGKPDLNDVDLIVVLPRDHDLLASLPPKAYLLLSKKQLRQHGYPFDVVVAVEGSQVCLDFIEFFGQVREQPAQTKGLLRLVP